ncbi:MAG: hypothetical protein IPL52_05995 [Flavobacteriales bacterium]|nr:hypothetical protein [Flavobacteriales bacterium]
MEEPILTAPMPSPDEFYAMWERLLQGDSADVLNETKIATIRGRGGAGSRWVSSCKPAKMRRTIQAMALPQNIVCNADEGDPAAFSDRYA